jgi:hypothetical protein
MILRQEDPAVARGGSKTAFAREQLCKHSVSSTKRKNAII